MPHRLPASDLIDAVLDNMRQNLEHLRYSSLAPSRYVVYVHPNEHARLAGILPRLQAETIRALDEELRRLNGGTLISRSVGRLTGQRPPIQSAGPEWHIEVVADPDGEIDEGTLLIDSELVLPAQPELGVGERTRRITTTVSQQRTTSREQTVSQERSPAAPIVFARLSYEDRGGLHTHEVVKDSITIGRGGVTYPVDIRVSSSEDVSREHARIRRDPKTGRFFLIDLSLLGTTLDGRHVPRGYDTSDDGKRENGTETPLPDRGRIGLADMLYLDFERVR
ncbi:MAG TPA: FHA domain-containing protein [Vicinamibacterales bacterium]|nr:FHA domain-containing protein [Vicinamibacterales bacterium]